MFMYGILLQETVALGLFDDTIPVEQKVKIAKHSKKRILSVLCSIFEECINLHRKNYIILFQKVHLNFLNSSEFYQILLLFPKIWNYLSGYQTWPYCSQKFYICESYRRNRCEAYKGVQCFYHKMKSKNTTYCN